LTPTTIENLQTTINKTAAKGKLAKFTITQCQPFRRKIESGALVVTAQPKAQRKRKSST